MYKAYQNGRKSQDSDAPVGYDEVHATAAHLLGLTSHRPQIGIICGSGLGGLVDLLENPFSLRYEDIPHFPVSTAPGHAGKLVFGDLGDKQCVCMQGRIHLYEGYPPWKVTFPIRVMKAMGVKILFVTNAAGALNEDYNVGDFMMLKSHLNIPGLAGNNPLMGPNDPRFGPRFPPLSHAYDPQLRCVARQAAEELGFRFLHEGVYVMVSGPCYETVAEARMQKLMGADVAGMSTVPEVMVAQHCGLRCFAMSLVTNKIVLDHDSTEQPADGDHVIAQGRTRSQDCQRFIAKMVKLIDLE